jgi:hypothetical protein
MNLVQIAAIVRKAVAILAILLFIYITALILKDPVQQTWYALLPPKDLPNYAFGLLDPLEFTEVPILTSDPNYVLNTRTGGLPTNLGNKMNVYQYVPPSFSFGEGERAQQDAATLGFNDDMRVSDLNAKVFVWQDVVFGGSLVINTQTRILYLTTPLSRIGSFFPAGQLTQTNAIANARLLLEELNRFSDKLYVLDTKGTQVVKFGKFLGNRVVEADSILEAQVARVDFFREVMDYPILGPDPKQGLLQVSMRAPNIEDGIPQLNYPKVKIYHWGIDTDSLATYPIIPVSTAWEKVTNNEGIIVNATPTETSPFEEAAPTRVEKILINDIYLAYFDNTLVQTFLQPIYVFEGAFTNREGGSAGTITIYYPAISGEYVRQPVANQTGQL